MASALMNMMVDEENKAKKPANGQPAQPAPSGQPATPQMPPPTPSVGTPAQVTNGGQGAQPQAPQPAGPDPLSLLALGQGPVNPARVPAQRRGVQRRGGGAPTPAVPAEAPPVPQMGTYTERSVEDVKGLVDSGAITEDDPMVQNLPIIRKDPTRKPVRGEIKPGLETPVSGLTADYNSAIMAINQRYNTGVITAEQRDREMAAETIWNNEQQGLPSQTKVETLGGKTQAQIDADRLYMAFDPTSDAYDNTRQSEAQMGMNIDISDKLLKQLRSTTASVNPVIAIRNVATEYQRQLAALSDQRAAILRGDVSAILRVMPEMSSDGILAQVLREFPGANIQQAMARAQNELGYEFDSERLNQYAKDAVAEIDRQREEIQGSDAYRAISNTSELIKTVPASRQQQLAKSVIGYALYLQDPDSQSGRDAKTYALELRMAGARGVGTTEKATQFEDLAVNVPGLERVFSRGKAKGIFSDVQKFGLQENYVEQLIKATGEGFIGRQESGQKLSPARKGEVGLFNAFLDPILNPVEGTTRPKWVSDMVYNMAQVIPVIDPNFETMLNMQDGKIKSTMLRGAAAGYKVKQQITNLLTFDYKDNPDQFAIDSIDVANAIKSGDTITAARRLAPYSSTDQLIGLFGEDVVLQNGIMGEKPSTLIPYDLSTATGFSGARKARIQAYKDRSDAQIRGQQRIKGTNFNLGNGRSVIASIAASFNIPGPLLGFSQSNQDVTDAYNTFSGGNDVGSASNLQQRGLLSDDLVSMISPAMNDKGEYVTDQIWSDSVETLDKAIYELESNINSGVVASDRTENAINLLGELKRARNSVRQDLELGIEIGGQRGFLFGNSNGNVDYSKPIRATSGSGRTAQAVDMLQAFATGTPGLDLPRYFSNNVTGRVSGSKTRVVGYAISEDGTPIDSKPVYATGTEDIVRVPVFKRDGGKWVPVLNIAGKQVYEIQPQDLTTQITAKAIATATGDQTSVGIDRNYVRMQINDLKAHIEKILYDPSGSEDLSQAQYEFERITGLTVYDQQRVGGEMVDVERRGKINIAEFSEYLQNLDRYKAKQLVGFLNAFGENPVLTPDTRVKWAMNASSSRGRGSDLGDKAIGNIEQDEIATARKYGKWAYDQGWQSLTATARNIVYEFDMDQSYDAEGGPDVRASQVDRIVKGVLDKHPYIRDAEDGASMMIREQLRQYAGALYDDDPDARRKIMIDTSKQIDALAQKEAVEAVDENVTQRIRESRLNIVKPTKQAELSSQEKLRIASEKFQEQSRQRTATQKRYKTLFFKGKGYVQIVGTNAQLDIWKDIDTKSIDWNTAQAVLEDTGTSWRGAKQGEVRQAVQQENPNIRIVKSGEKVKLRPRIPPKPAPVPTPPPPVRATVQLPKKGIQMPKIGTGTKRVGSGALLSILANQEMNKKRVR